MGNSLLKKCLYSLLNTAAFLLSFLTFVIPAFIAYYLSKPFCKEPERNFQKVANFMLSAYIKLSPGYSVKPVLGNFLDEGAIYLCTHQSKLDFPILATLVKSYMTPTNVRVDKYPIIAKGANLMGVRYLDIADASSLYIVFEQMRSHLDQGKNLLIFAEGSRHTGEKLNKFKGGAFALAKQLNCPIVPVIIEGTGKIYPKGASCYATSQHVEVVVSLLEPLRAEDFESEGYMKRHAQKVMQQEKDRLCATYFSS